MSAPSSPRIGQTTKHDALHKKRDRPTTLGIPAEDREAVLDGEVRYAPEYLPSEEICIEQVSLVSNLTNRASFILSQLHPPHHVNVNISVTEDSSVEPGQIISRSASATSSLDPYYFGIQSESESPIPPMLPASIYLSTTPDHPPFNEPATPARNPAMIDRRGLVGVGELATPRWARDDRENEPEEPDSDVEPEGYDVIIPDDIEEDQPDSPWTIEAIDGESSEKEEV